jgi:hypothetical protein
MRMVPEDLPPGVHFISMPRMTTDTIVSMRENSDPGTGAQDRQREALRP